MRRGTIIAAAAVAALSFAGAAASQSPLGLPQRVQSGAEPDVNHGRMVTIGGMFGDLRIGCVQCHGLDGVGDSSGAFPRLTDQSGWYLYKTLQDYAAGLRPSDIMGPIAAMLSDRQMRDVAAYYATVKGAPYPAKPEVNVTTLQIGGAIAAIGIPEQGVPACNSCHGPNGIGQPPIYPYLAGQYAPYTQHQLILWKEGRRDGDAMNIMRLIAQAMTDEQIRAVSLYFASVRPAEVTPADRTVGGTGTGAAAAARARNSDVGAVRNPQPGPGSVVVPGAQPSAPPAPGVSAPIGLPRRPLPANVLPPYLSAPGGGAGLDETTKTTGQQPGASR